MQTAVRTGVLLLVLLAVGCSLEPPPRADLHVPDPTTRPPLSAQTPRPREAGSPLPLAAISPIPLPTQVTNAERSRPSPSPTSHPPVAQCTATAAAFPSPTPRPLVSAAPVRLAEGTPGLELSNVLVALHGVTMGEANGVLSGIEADVTAVEKIFGARFPTKPKIALYAGSEALAAALPIVVPGLAGTPALTISSLNTVYVDMSALREQYLPSIALRHELTHLMVGTLVGSGRESSVPQWFNEGLARLSQESAVGSERQASEGRYYVASAARAGTLQSLDALRSSATWLAQRAREDSEGAQVSPYPLAAEVVRLLRDDLGVPGLVRILQLIREGRSFEQAYSTVAKQSWGAFSASYPSRLASLVERAPGAVVLGAAPLDTSVELLLWGLPPNKDLALEIFAPCSSTRISALITTGAMGAYANSFLEAPLGPLQLLLSGEGVPMLELRLEPPTR